MMNLKREGLQGDAELLPSGRCFMDFKVEFQGEVREFHGVKFEVVKGKKTSLRQSGVTRLITICLLQGG